MMIFAFHAHFQPQMGITGGTMGIGWLFTAQYQQFAFAAVIYIFAVFCNIVPQMSISPPAIGVRRGTLLNGQYPALAADVHLFCGTDGRKREYHKKQYEYFFHRTGSQGRGSRIGQ